jgi:hypothetical protein
MASASVFRDMTERLAALQRAVQPEVEADGDEADE